MRRVGAMITVYVSLVLLLLIAFSAALFESAAIQTNKNRIHARTSLALSSLFAEYDPDLQERYHLFAVDSGREGEADTGGFVKERLDFYRAGCADAAVQKVRYLSDENAAALCEQALLYMTQREGGPGADEDGMSDEQIRREAGTIQERRDEAAQMAGQQESIIRQFAGALKEVGEQEAQGGGEQSEAPEGLSALDAQTFGALADLLQPDLKVLWPEGEAAYTRKIDLAQTASHRALRSGSGTFQTDTGISGEAGRLLFDAYLDEVMVCAGRNTNEPHVLACELEYILGGKESDKENLEKALSGILALRTAENVKCLSGDAPRQEELTAAAVFLAAAMGMPEASDGLRAALEAAWACGESVLEVRALASGSKMPLVKKPEQWTLSLAGLLVLAAGGGRDWESPDYRVGISYRDYLRAFLTLVPAGTKRMRALDLIELNIGEERGQALLADRCLCALQIRGKAELEHAVRYEFASAFTYR